jgi:predicted Fe-S protein YdhL (DUF1289 family)
MVLPKSFTPPTQPNTGTLSPCVRLCTLNEQDICVGCGRTLDDIKLWSRMSEPEKADCVARAAQTRATLAHPWSSAAAPGKP